MANNPTMASVLAGVSWRELAAAWLRGSEEANNAAGKAIAGLEDVDGAWTIADMVMKALADAAAFDHAPPAHDRGVDRSEPPPGWFWEEEAGSRRTGFVMQGNRQTLRAAWTIHDTLTAPIEARAREAEQANEAWREWAGIEGRSHASDDTELRVAVANRFKADVAAAREAGREEGRHEGVMESAAWLRRRGDTTRAAWLEEHLAQSDEAPSPKSTRRSADHAASVRMAAREAAPMDGTPDDEYEDCPACDGEAVSPDDTATHEEVCAYVSHDVLDDGGGRCNTCRVILPACPVCGPYHGRKYFRPEPPANPTEPDAVEELADIIDKDLWSCAPQLRARMRKALTSLASRLDRATYDAMAAAAPSKPTATTADFRAEMEAGREEGRLAGLREAGEVAERAEETWRQLGVVWGIDDVLQVLRDAAAVAADDDEPLPALHRLEEVTARAVGVVTPAAPPQGAGPAYPEGYPSTPGEHAAYRDGLRHGAEYERGPWLLWCGEILMSVCEREDGYPDVSPGKVRDFVLANLRTRVRCLAAPSAPQGGPAPDPTRPAPYMPRVGERVEAWRAFADDEAEAIGWAPPMRRFVGAVGVVKDINTHGDALVAFDDPEDGYDTWWWARAALRPTSDEPGSGGAS